jgi:Xaa-Pro dipeptidase
LAQTHRARGAQHLAPYDENPPDLTVGEDDIVFLDFGPVFEEWEADFGRTYVVGNDPLKHKLRRDIEETFARAKEYFHEHAETAAELMRTLNNWRCKLAGSTAAPLRAI